MNLPILTYEDEIVLPNLLGMTAHIVAVFWGFQFFPDTLPLLDGAKEAIGGDEALSTVAASSIAIFATAPRFLSEFLQQARF